MTASWAPCTPATSSVPSVRWPRDRTSRRLRGLTWPACRCVPVNRGIGVSEPGPAPARADPRRRDRGCAQVRRAQAVCGDGPTAAPHGRPRPQWFEQHSCACLASVDSNWASCGCFATCPALGSPLDSSPTRGLGARVLLQAAVQHAPGLLRRFAATFPVGTATRSPCAAQVEASLSRGPGTSRDALSALQLTRTTPRTPSWPPSCCGSCGRPAPRTPWCRSKVQGSSPALSCWPKGLTRWRFHFAEFGAVTAEVFLPVFNNRNAAATVLGSALSTLKAGAEAYAVSCRHRCSARARHNR